MEHKNEKRTRNRHEENNEFDSLDEKIARLEQKIEKQTRSRSRHEKNNKFDSIVKNDDNKAEKPRKIPAQNFNIHPDKLSQLRHQIKSQQGKEYKL